MNDSTVTSYQKIGLCHSTRHSCPNCSQLPKKQFRFGLTAAREPRQDFAVSLVHIKELASGFFGVAVVHGAHELRAFVDDAVHADVVGEREEGDKLALRNFDIQPTGKARGLALQVL